MNIKEKFSTLWIIVMFNIVMADIFGFAMDKMAGPNTEVFQVPMIGMLIFAMVQELPIAMIFLSRVLNYRVNRYSNIIFSLITIAYVIGGRTDNMVYYFFAAVEVVCLLSIIWSAWKWDPSEV